MRDFPHDCGTVDTYAMRRLTSLKLLLLLAMVLPRYVKLSVVVTGCVPMSVDGGVGIHGLKD